MRPACVPTQRDRPRSGLTCNRTAMSTQRSRSRSIRVADPMALRMRGVPPSAARIRFGTAAVTYDYAVYLNWVRAADELGYDFAGHGDSQLLWADVHVTLAAGAMATSR